MYPLIFCTRRDLVLVRYTQFEEIILSGGEMHAKMQGPVNAVLGTRGFNDSEMESKGYRLDALDYLMANLKAQVDWLT